MRSEWPTIVIAIVFIAAAAPADPAIEKEIKQLQGTWQMVSHEVDGKPDEALRGALRIVEGDKITITRDGKVLRTATTKLDPSKFPKWIDVTFTEGLEKGKSRHGIYTLDGDMQRICFGDLNKERPTEFVSKPGTAHRLVIFKRIKP